MLEPELVTVPQLAELLGISRAKAYQMIADGTIGPVLHLGRSSRVRLSDVIRWIDQSIEEQQRAAQAADVA